MDVPPHHGQPGTTSAVEQILYEVKKTIVGQDALLERLLVALLSRGHILVEGVPGLAKTLAVKALAGAIGGQDRKSTRLNSSHSQISYAVFCLKKKKKKKRRNNESKYK